MESKDENDRQQNSAATEEGGVATKETVDDKEDFGYDEMVSMYDESMRHLNEGQIVTGHVIAITGNHVIVDVGYKSEGLIPINEFTDHEGTTHVAEGDEVEVLLEKTEDAEGYVLVSKIKAERMKVWCRSANSRTTRARSQSR